MIRCIGVGVARCGSANLNSMRSSLWSSSFRRLNSSHNPNFDWSVYPARGPTNWKTPDGKLRLEYLLLQTVEDTEVEKEVSLFMSLMLGRIITYRESVDMTKWGFLGPEASIRITKMVILMKVLFDRELVDSWTDFMDFLESKGYETTSQDITLVGNFIADWLGVNKQ